jgi:hypothetical protein
MEKAGSKTVTPDSILESTNILTPEAINDHKEDGFEARGNSRPDRTAER